MILLSTHLLVLLFKCSDGKKKLGKINSELSNFAFYNLGTEIIETVL